MIAQDTVDLSCHWKTFVSLTTGSKDYDYLEYGRWKFIITEEV